jgi:trigger factor
VASVPAALKTTLTELPDSRVRLQVEVPPSEIEGRLESKARQLGKELKLPGFRRGKVPAPLVLQRVGREVVLEEAVRDTLSRWYADAIVTAGIVPVGDPKVDLDMDRLPSKGEALEFSIEIGVLPTAELGDYRELEVPRREIEISDEQIDREVEGIRERLARLETAERAAASGDFVVIDYVGTMEGEEQPFAGGEGRDQLIELGSGNLIPGFEEQLVGAGAGETRTVALSFPDDYPNTELAGRAAGFEVTVKEVKVKELPPLDDDLAIDSGFDDLGELRADIREKLTEHEREHVQKEFRQAALDAAVGDAKVPLTDELIKARAKEMWERMLHSLAHRGISREAYLQILGREQEELLAESEAEAAQALRREAVITAVVEAERISPGEEDMLVAVTPTAEREGVEPERLLDQLRGAGRLEELREDLAAQQAIDLISSSAKPIPLAQAEAREKLWTPEKEAEERQTAQTGTTAADKEPSRLWTPDR